MVSFVLTGHGSFAEGLASALTMIAGAQPQLYVVVFDDENAWSLPERLSDVIDAAEQVSGGSGVLVLCDLFGGTPFNQAMLKTYPMTNAAVVTGANLPMLLSLTSARGSGASLDELVATALESGQEGIVHRVLEPMDESDEDLDEADDF